jgi:hypothetical protein
MLAQTIVMIVSAAISLLAIIISYKTNSKANKIALQNASLAAQNTALAAENTRLSNGNLEIQLRGMISGSNKLLCSVLQSLYSQETVLKRRKELEESIIGIVDQEILNAYEEACMKYLDGKVDKERFKKTYIVEIRNVVKKYEAKLGASTSYTAISKVNKEWNDLEG